MRRTTWALCPGKSGGISWQTRAKLKLQDAVRKWVPDPRDRREMAQEGRPSSYSEIKSKRQSVPLEGIEAMGKDETLEEYMKRRDSDWLKERAAEISTMTAGSKAASSATIEVAGHTVPFMATYDMPRDAYQTTKGASEHAKEIVEKQWSVDEEKLLLRRQLQMENESEFRKHQAEMKRAELNLASNAKRRLPHPSDPNYDPFKNTPSYRPQDSRQLAAWLKRQRESGKTQSGLSLNTREGQERFYNEEKMATQFHANPFAKHIEHPKGVTMLQPTAYTPDSVFIDNKEVIGAAILTPTNYYHWNVNTPEDINLKTLSLLLHLYPVPDVLFIGTGRNQLQLDSEIIIEFQKRGTVVWCMATPRALSEHSQQLDLTRRSVCAYIPPLGTSGYGTECFGDFIENDMYSLSDTQLGIPADRQMNSQLRPHNKIAEKYRHMQGTGYGPKYYELSDGRLVRPGTSGTKLRPMIEPGEEIEWEKLPSYYHWYPKEHLHDYIENTTYRETAGKPHGDQTERRMRSQVRGVDISLLEKGEEPEEQVMPWDSKSIPTSIIPALRDPKNIGVEDIKTGRVVGMTEEGYARYKVMMQERAEGKEPSDPVEFDQERFVANREGMIYDMSKAKYVPLFEGRYNPQRHSSTGRGNQPFMP